MEKLLNDLLICDGVSGYEENVAKIMAESLRKVCNSTEIDNFGNVIGKLGEGKKKLMLVAHMDEIGMVVKYVSEKGFIYFIKVGGLNDSILPGKIVKIINKNGEHVTGIIGTKPPHLMNIEESKKLIKYDTMFIDIGLHSKDEVLKVIDIGDQIAFESSAGILSENIYYGKAVDNRIGCYAMLKVMEILAKSKDLDAEIYACATVQEEVGLKGGKTSSFNVNPDFALVIDTTITGDIPGIEEKVSTIKLGKGVAITIIEASGRGTIVSQKVRKLMLDTARENMIPHQIDVINGGVTDGATIQISRKGILTGILSIPTRYIHAPTSVFNIKDVNSAVDLAVKTISKVTKAL
ncbi:MAG: M42 family metallopeptidase [Endomicrobium sp.]|jgi:endoglucanase|nr:M42 family metallopeptidase [Endomicrobium sp.]